MWCTPGHSNVINIYCFVSLQWVLVPSVKTFLMQWACKRPSKAIEIRKWEVFQKHTKLATFPHSLGTHVPGRHRCRLVEMGKWEGERRQIGPRSPLHRCKAHLHLRFSRYSSHLRGTLAFGSQQHWRQQGNLFPGYTVTWNIASQALIATGICLSAAVTAGSVGGVGNVLQLCALWRTPEKHMAICICTRMHISSAQEAPCWVPST